MGSVMTCFDTLMITSKSLQSKETSWKRVPFHKFDECYKFVTVIFLHRCYKFIAQKTIITNCPQPFSCSKKVQISKILLDEF